jgi:cell fate regulator YaaT (PSP1 superfamily)
MIPTDKIEEGVVEQVVCEIEFKGSRRDYFACPDTISLKPGDFVIVQADRGEHIGRFLRCGPRSHYPQAKEIKSILRKASYTDVEIMVDNRRKDEEAFEVCLKKIETHDLKMKLVDVEYQFDGNKICFYFTADKRIDFRALVKDLAAEYRTRIELRQIGVRDEARRLGGLGVCGRMLCCKTFLCQFEPITSQMARDQNLSLSPSKISGLCGRLMCCLAYEETFYKLQSDQLPQSGSIVERDGRKYQVMKVDIFNEFFSLRDEAGLEKTLSITEFEGYLTVQLPEPPQGKCCGGRRDRKQGGDNRKAAEAEIVESEPETVESGPEEEIPL